MKSMFERLMELPLFRGVSHARLAQTVGESKFHFLKYATGETIIRAGEPCTHITFVISGSVRCLVENPRSRFSVESILNAPGVICTDFLFGKTTTYPYTISARDNVSILQIDKSDYINILYSDQVFMFNYLNALSVNAQKAFFGALSQTGGGFDKRIAFYILGLTPPGSCEIHLGCHSQELHKLFEIPPETFEATMETMKERGLILDYTDRGILVGDRKGLLRLIESPLYQKE